MEGKLDDLVIFIFCSLFFDLSSWFLILDSIFPIFILATAKSVRPKLNRHEKSL